MQVKRDLVCYWRQISDSVKLRRGAFDVDLSQKQAHTTD